jgi:2-polyprenyl-3-methyl-5-hydroxy-6-metoxy-1,4-benzoquinol methylase
MLDLVGMLGYQAVSTAVQLNIFTALAERPSTVPELAQRLHAEERGIHSLLRALAAIGYVEERDGRFHNSPMTTKWFGQSDIMDVSVALHVWDVFLRDLWPHAVEIIQTGERPFNFYDFIYSDPQMGHSFQEMMVGNAYTAGAELLKKLTLPDEAQVLDVGGGHGVVSMVLAKAHPQLQATILDAAAALQTAKPHIRKHNLHGRIHLKPGDMWQVDWGKQYDLILLFNMVHHFDLDSNRQLLQKAHAALKPGGQIAIFDQIEGSVFGSASNAIVQLLALMFYLFANGRVYSADEMTTLLTETGFKQPQVTKMRQSPGSSLITAVK